jgi:hypothetical protein
MLNLLWSLLAAPRSRRKKHGELAPEHLGLFRRFGALNRAPGKRRPGLEPWDRKLWVLSGVGAIALWSKDCRGADRSHEPEASARPPPPPASSEPLGAPGTAGPERVPPKSWLEQRWDPKTGKGDVIHHCSNGDLLRTCLHCGYPPGPELILGTYCGLGQGAYLLKNPDNAWAITKKPSMGLTLTKKEGYEGKLGLGA